MSTTKNDQHSQEQMRLENFSCLKNQKPLFRPLNLRLNCGDSLHAQAANGIGKTTLLKALYGLAIETTGNIYWNQQKLETNLANKSVYINDRNGTFSYLTPIESLQKTLIITDNWIHADKIESALDKMGLYQQRKQLCYTLSKGQKKRLHLARLLLQEKPVWLLDEPFDGLDVAGTKLLIDILTNHASNGGVHIYTSHIQHLTNYCPSKTIILESAQ